MRSRLVIVRKVGAKSAFQVHLIECGTSTLQVEESLELRPTNAQGSSDNTTLESAERDHILRILEETDWVILGPRGAAGILNLHPNTLRSRMQNFAIKRTTSFT